jgi:hypothetical protein
MIAIIKGAQRDSTAFGCGIICSRLSQQGSLCQGFTGAVAHKALPSVPYMEMGMGIGTTEWRIGTTRVATRCGTGRVACRTF